MGSAERITLKSLWSSAEPTGQAFGTEHVRDLPEPAKTYLCRAVKGGTPIARAVRLTMHGEMKLNDVWQPFEAEQVIHAEHGFIWKAKTRVGIMRVSGSDRHIDGKGSVRWKALGLFPVVSQGPDDDINCSSADRFRIESMLLPSMLLGPDVRWRVLEDEKLEVYVPAFGFGGWHTVLLSGDGHLLEASMSRWGSPDGKTFTEAPFGALIQESRTFDGYTIPSELRVGWDFGTDKFDESGEFWRATIDDAEFR
jgi:hypothetical protein